MPVSSTDDIPTQLAALLGKGADIVSIRKTNEDPPAVSVIDVVQVARGRPGDARVHLQSTTST